MIGFSECRQGGSFVTVLERKIAVIQGVFFSRREVDVLFEFWQAPGKFGFVKIIYPWFLVWENFYFDRLNDLTY